MAVLIICMAALKKNTSLPRRPKCTRPVNVGRVINLSSAIDEDFSKIVKLCRLSTMQYCHHFNLAKCEAERGTKTLTTKLNLRGA